jgi:NAD(P)-dependent dehydrogenase (short-subunit alcohol dehydrogenase family)
VKRLNQKIAVVTGGATRIGVGIAQRPTDEGARVVIPDVQQELGDAVARRHGFEFLEQDVRSEERWVHVIREVEARHSRCDILMNDAGIRGSMSRVTPESTALDDWRMIFGVNVEGAFLGCRAVVPVMRRAGGGAIVNASSVAGLLATPYATAYGASKAAIRELTKSVAQYCTQARLNIRCNSAHPGNVRTPLCDRRAWELSPTRAVPLDQILREGAQEVPMGDFTRMEDVAAAVAFLASEDARHVNGTNMIVDGGIVNCDTYHSAPNDWAGEQGP